MGKFVKSSIRWRHKDVLVTGGASFIGSHLVDALIDRGAAVRVADDLSSGVKANLNRHFGSSRFEFVEADLRDPLCARSIVADMDIVFHLAADHGGRGYIDTHQVACAGNFGLDSVVFRACAALQVEKIIYASSGCVYPPTLQADPRCEIFLREEDVGPPYEADKVYGWAKLMGELTLATYAQETSIQTASCRLFTAYGERCDESHAVIAMIARAFIGQDPFLVWGDGEQIRNWTYVGDVVEGVIRTAEMIGDGSAVNIGTMERIRVLDVAQEVLRFTGLDAEIHLQRDMPTGPRNRVADTRRASELLGWRPETSFLDGLHQTIDWYFAEKNREAVRATLEAKLFERPKAESIDQNQV